MASFLVKHFTSINYMQKSICLLALLTIISIAATAQSYTTAAGIRLGPNTAAISPGLTIKHFISDNTALEGIVGINNGLGICALYEKHFGINAVENLQWYAGGGGYAAFRNKTSSIGVAGIIGLDYKFDQIPLNISLDWKPELNIISKVGFEASAVGVSARFTF